MTFEQWYKAMIADGWQPMGTQIGMFDDIDMPGWMHENGNLLSANDAENYWRRGIVPPPF